MRIRRHFGDSWKLQNSTRHSLFVKLLPFKNASTRIGSNVIAPSTCDSLFYLWSDFFTKYRCAIPYPLCVKIVSKHILLHIKPRVAGNLCKAKIDTRAFGSNVKSKRNLIWNDKCILGIPQHIKSQIAHIQFLILCNTLDHNAYFSNLHSFKIRKPNKFCNIFWYFLKVAPIMLGSGFFCNVNSWECERETSWPSQAASRQLSIFTNSVYWQVNILTQKVNL